MLGIVDSDVKKQIVDRFHVLFKQMQRIREKDLSLEKRKILRKHFDQELEWIVETMKNYKVLPKLGTKIENGMPYWFTCIEHPEVEQQNKQNIQQATTQLLINTNKP